MTKRSLAFASMLVLVLMPALAGASVNANDTYLGRQWGMTKIGAPTAWQTGTGKGVTIAIIDTGIALDHEDLKAKIVQGHDYIDGDNNPTPDGPNPDPIDAGHGTHVAGIAAASTGNSYGVAGVAPDAKIMPLRVLDETGSCGGSSGPPCHIEDAIHYAVQNHAAVINLSLGNQVQAVLGPSFGQALRDAWDAGSICVVAGGNEVVMSGYSDEPALVVGATDRNDVMPQTYSSKVGDAMWGLVAPGGADPNTSSDADEIFSTFWTTQNKTTSFAYLSGTSMAAPHVSGAAAVLLSLGLTPQQTVDRILSTADNVGPSLFYGHGRLNLAKAVAGLQPVSSGGGTTAGGSGSGGGKTSRTGSRSSGTSNATSTPSPGQSVTPGPSAGTSPKAQAAGISGTAGASAPGKRGGSPVALAAGLLVVVGAASSYLAWHKQKVH
ncbi:MAG: S8 family serine peptidase [Actinomycetota bacterium]|nr:S8 family serine peptidase [Actinomycetota bacterium]